MSRIEPLEPPYQLAVEEQLAAMMPTGVAPIALFRVFARNLAMAQAMHGWGTYALSRSLSLSLREREIVIDRTCARCGCEYEWGVHVAFFAERAGFDATQLWSLTFGTADDGCWSDRERLLIEVVDALHADADIGDELWGRCAAALTDQELLDLLMLCGWYHAVAFAANATRVPLEPGAPRFEDHR